MKNIIKYISLIPLAIVFSCSELLDIEAEGTISGDILTDQENIQKALNGAYYNFTGIADGVDGGELIGGDFIIIPTLLARRSDNIFSEVRWEFVLAPVSYQDFVNKDILNTNGRVQANWRRAYETINVLNNILVNIDNIEDSQQKQRIRGEVLAMRGILYFEMVKLWAPHYTNGNYDPSTTPALPLMLEEDAISDIEQIPELSIADFNTTEEVYQQAEQDLTNASTALQSFGKNEPNLSYFACQAYLTRLYLQKGEYSSALESSNNVINSGEFQLAPTPRDAFNNPVNSQEDIFAVQQTLANNAGDRTNGIGVTAFYSSLEESGLGTMGIFRSSLTIDLLYNSPLYEDNDLRGTIDVNINDNVSSDQISTAFYRNLANNSNELLSSSKYMSASHVIPVIRLAEMYLSRAEAAFESFGAQINDQALSDLNAVRTRAGLTPLQTSDFANEFAFFDSLTVERNRELYLEGQLLHDLKRWRTFGPFYYVGANLQGERLDPWDERFVLPVPQSELDAGDFD